MHKAFVGSEYDYVYKLLRRAKDTTTWFEYPDVYSSREQLLSYVEKELDDFKDDSEYCIIPIKVDTIKIVKSF